MAQLTLNGYLTKRTAENRFGRHRRTLTDDISKALISGDEELLSLCRIRTKEGRVQEARGLSPDDIKSLVANGENPIWYILPEFVETVVKRKAALRGEPEEEAEEEITEEPVPIDSAPTREQAAPAEPSDIIANLPKDAEERARMLQALYLDAMRARDEERQRNEKIFSLIETIPKQQEQTNVLLREFQNLMKRESLDSPGNMGSGTAPQIVEAPVTESSEAIEVEAEAVATMKKPTAPKKKSGSAKKSASKNTRKAPPTFAEEHLPTMSRWLDRLSSKKR